MRVGKMRFRRVGRTIHPRPWAKEYRSAPGGTDSSARENEPVPGSLADGRSSDSYERPERPGRGTGTFSRDCVRRRIDPRSGELIQARGKMSQSPGGGRMGVPIPDNVPSRRQNQSPAPLGHPTTPAPPRKNPRQRHAGRRGQSLKGISILAQGSHRRWLPWVPAPPTDQS